MEGLLPQGFRILKSSLSLRVAWQVNIPSLTRNSSVDPLLPAFQWTG